MARSTFTPAQDQTFTGPVRTCIGCRERAAKHELLRVTVASDADGPSTVSPDPGATAPGRGAYLHPTTECVDLALRRRAFGRALRSDALDGAAVSDYVAAIEMTLK